MAELPLKNQTVLVTRPAEQADSLATFLVNAGAQVLFQPAIEIRSPQDFSKVDAAIGDLQDFNWIVFVSANGVKYFLERLHKNRENSDFLRRIKVAAIGTRTAIELQNRGIEVSLRPDKFDSGGLAGVLIASLPGDPQRILLVRANRGSDELPRRLTFAGHFITQIAAYESVDVEIAKADILEQMTDRKVDWVTVTSSAIAVSVVRLFGERLRHTKLASISPTTSSKLAELGFPPAAEAIDFSMGGLVQAMVRS